MAPVRRPQVRDRGDAQVPQHRRLRDHRVHGPALGGERPAEHLAPAEGVPPPARAVPAARHRLRRLAAAELLGKRPLQRRGLGLPLLGPRPAGLHRRVEYQRPGRRRSHPLGRRRAHGCAAGRHRLLRRAAAGRVRAGAAAPAAAGHPGAHRRPERADPLVLPRRLLPSQGSGSTDLGV